MSKQKIWKYLSLVFGTLLMLSVMPEIRALGLFIDVLGLDILLLTIEGYAITYIAFLYHSQIKPTLSSINRFFSKLDPLYFIPSRAQIYQCPQLIFHSVPRLVTCSSIALSVALIYA